MARLVIGTNKQNGVPAVVRDMSPTHYMTLDMTNGVLKKGALNNLDFSSATSIPLNGLYYAFAHCGSDVLGRVDLSNVTSVADYGLTYAFYRTDITFVDMSSLVICNANYGFEYAFRNTKLTGFDFSNLVEAQGGGYSFHYAFGDNPTLVGAFSFPKLEIACAFNSAFSNDTGITFFGFPKLKTIGKSGNSSGMQSMFGGCRNLIGTNLNAVERILGDYQQMRETFTKTAIQVFRFPMLTSVTGGFGTSGVFPTVTTELHFRTDAQATIETAAGYSNKWGATNATVYFDLVGTLTGADGNTYTRDEYNSVYSDQHGQFQTAVAWKHNNTTYYTVAGTEPTVGTIIYSDAACQTSVTTVTAIA